MNELEDYFKKLRFDENHHLGMGDIRLTIAQQEEIVEMVKGLLKNDHQRMSVWHVAYHRLTKTNKMKNEKDINDKDEKQCAIQNVRRSVLVKEFMEKKGYSNYTNEFGVRRDHKENKTWDFKDPSKMLQDFVVFLKHYA
jgi:coproporphyrinogen III oxidase-like Fe-S oxidoreductase